MQDTPSPLPLAVFASPTMNFPGCSLPPMRVCQLIHCIRGQIATVEGVPVRRHRLLRWPRGLGNCRRPSTEGKQRTHRRWEQARETETERGAPARQRQRARSQNGGRGTRAKECAGRRLPRLPSLAHRFYVSPQGGLVGNGYRGRRSSRSPQQTHASPRRDGCMRLERLCVYGSSINSLKSHLASPLQVTHGGFSAAEHSVCGTAPPTARAGLPAGGPGFPPAPHKRYGGPLPRILVHCLLNVHAWSS